MNYISKAISQIKAQINNLQVALAALEQANGPKRGRPPGVLNRRITAASAKRAARNSRKIFEEITTLHVGSKNRPGREKRKPHKDAAKKHRVSAAGQRRIKAATRRYWKEVKAGKRKRAGFHQLLNGRDKSIRVSV